MIKQPKLASVLDADRNSFNLIRLVAALAVVYSHSFLIPIGPDAKEPLLGITPFNLSQHAVNGFFVLSGLTLAQSIALKPNILSFAIARALRIFPALVGFGLVFAFLVGPFVTKLPMSEYWGDLHTWVYALGVPVFFQHATPPHEIFTTVPLAGSVNNPLWTIKYEVAAYVALAICSVIGVLRSRDGVLLSTAIIFGLLVIFESDSDEGLRSALHQVARFGFCFMLGVLAYFYRERLPVSWAFLPLTLLIAFVLRGTFIEKHAFLIAVAHLVIVFGAINYGALTRWTRETDISYGVYIYGWPTQQLIVTLFGSISIPGLALLSLLIVPMLGFLSWHLIEKPALNFKKVLRRSPKEVASERGVP
jgi:peptidoglycan/LPS O-acetylase OafA/YrhL